MSVESKDAPESPPAAGEERCKGVDLVIEPRKRDLGGFTVGRVLPYAKRRMVGPFIFFDEMGPARFAPGEGIDVRPHPHIGLATVTYLFEGEIRHKDSLGYDQTIRPGDVNWMTAGRGVVHSERTGEALRAAGHALHGIQSWVALPESDEETAPAFHHHPKESLPVIEKDGASMRLIVGTAFGETAPVETFSGIFYLAVEAGEGAPIALPQDHEERALYLVDGALDVNGERVEKGRMLVFAEGAAPTIRALAPSRAMLLGGANIGPRHIWWNLVAASPEKIEAGKRDWNDAAAAGFSGGRFTLPPGETEHIPAPEN